jgi:hypothetical protein
VKETEDMALVFAAVYDNKQIPGRGSDIHDLLETYKIVSDIEEDYLSGLRRMTRQHDPSVLIKAMRYGHDYTSRLDFADLGQATGTLRATKAFREPDSYDRLILPADLEAGD